jgi:hypothetical protein
VTAPRRPARSRSDEPRSNVVGAALIAAAVVIGFVLLLRGFDQEGGLVATDDVTTTTVAEGADPDATTTTTTTPTSPPASVSVLVANGSGAAGVAGQRQTTLNGAGYTDVETSNAPNPVPQTSVYFGPGLQADAVAVADALNLPPAVVSALPSPPPFDTQGADVVVVIGTDGA